MYEKTGLKRLEQMDYQNRWFYRMMDLADELPQCGYRTIRKNNILYANALHWHRRIPEGEYLVWANDNRGIFVDTSTMTAILVFPGV